MALVLLLAGDGRVRAQEVEDLEFAPDPFAGAGLKLETGAEGGGCEVAELRLSVAADMERVEFVAVHMAATQESGVRAVDGRLTAREWWPSWSCSVRSIVCWRGGSRCGRWCFALLVIRLRHGIAQVVIDRGKGIVDPLDLRLAQWTLWMFLKPADEAEEVESGVIARRCDGSFANGFEADHAGLQ